MTSLSFRAATADDLDALVELVTSAYRGNVSKQGWTTEADMLEGQRIDPDVLLQDIQRLKSRVVVAEQDNRMLACAHVAEQEGTGYFGMFAVRPNLQGTGTGKLLLAETERIARDEWRLPAMRMTVIDIRQELIAFYERRGYRRTGITKPFPYGDVRFGIPKRDDLRFEILRKDFQETGA